MRRAFALAACLLAAACQIGPTTVKTGGAVEVTAVINGFSPGTDGPAERDR